MEPTTADLDAFLMETLGVKQKFTLYGREWTLKSELPLVTRLKIEAAGTGDADESTASEIDLLRTMMDPPEQVDELVELGLGVVAFTTLLKVGFLVGSGMSAEAALEVVREDAAAEKAAAEKAATETAEAADGPKEETETQSSNTGQSLKPTSKQSTESP